MGRRGGTRFPLDWGGIEEGDVPTDLHGLARIEDGEIGLGAMGYAFLLLSH